MGAEPAPGRLHFANQLRGLAALSVAISHLIGVYWLMQGLLELTTLAPAQGGALPPIVGLVNFEWFQAGPFGVGLFFLISGLVVPFSLERHTAGSFVLARVLRIYPTYWAGLAVQLGALLWASRIWGHPVPYDWRTVLANGLLVHDLAGRPSIDLVNWTLTIELRFYVAVALLAPWLRRGLLRAAFGPAILCCAGSAILGSGVFGPLPADPSRPGFTVSSELPFFIMMFMGVLFHFHVRGRIGTGVLAGGVLSLAGMMAAAWWFSVLRGQFTHVLNNYGYALVVFGALYALRGRIGANGLLDRMAAVSYPFYLVHATVGFFVMKGLMLLWGLGYLPALGAAVAVAGSVAWALHVAIETPSIRWGHALAPGRAGAGRARRVTPATSP